MRRNDREINDVTDIIGILTKAEVLRIALNDGMYPYILPVNYGFDMDNGTLTLYFHSSKCGYKHSLINRDNHASFEIDCSYSLIRPSDGAPCCTASFAYESVIGKGVISIVDDTEKQKCLLKILIHYGINADNFNPKVLENTVVYIITASEFTAKRNIK